MKFKIHYKNPKKPNHTICGHDCMIPGRTFSNTTTLTKEVSCAACIKAIKRAEAAKQ